MKNSHTQLRELGASIAGMQNRILQTHSQLGEVYDNLAFTHESYPPQVNRRMGYRGATAFAIAAAALAAVLFYYTAGESRLEAYNGKEKIDVGSWISSDSNTTLALSFSDGSSVSLEQMGSARIQELKSDGAHIVVEKGTINAHIQHNPNTNWQFSVGPYQIHVTGTRFRVSWNTAAKRLNLHMKEGTVNISGPMISHFKTVSAGESLNASLTLGKMEYYTATGKTGTDAAAMSEVNTSKTSSEKLNADKPPTPSTGVRIRKRPSSEWLTDAKSGSYTEAVQKAQSIGIAYLLQSARSGDLLLLGDAARHSGNLEMATKVYTHVRKKFHGSAAAGNATFALGVMAYHQQHNYSAAARWFEQLLDQKGESAGLRREALGRLIEINRRTGQKEKAQRYANTYLVNYPQGPHAALATKVLE